MKLELFRIDHDQESTTGLLKIDGKFESFTLEDQFQEVKVKGETRIPTGTYKVALRQEESPLTMKYRKRFPWFDFHIQIMDVPNFEYVYIHVGNTEKHTDACILVGDSITNQGERDDFLGKSVQAFERIYKRLHPVLMSDEPVTITIQNL